jgi:hypothetical protein
MTCSNKPADTADNDTIDGTNGICLQDNDADTDMADKWCC